MPLKKKKRWWNTQSNIILDLPIYRMVRNFHGTKFSRIGHWQRFREKLFAARRWQSYAHTGCMLATPTSHVKVQWWWASLAMVRGYQTFEDILDATVGKEQPCQREPDIINHHRHQATAWHSPFPFTNRLFSMLFTPMSAKTMEDGGTFVGRQPVGSGSLVACPRY